MQDEMGLGRDTILELLDCYTVLLSLLSELSSSITKRVTIDATYTINVKCKTFFNDLLLLKCFNKAKKVS